MSRRRWTLALGLALVLGGGAVALRAVPRAGAAPRPGEGRRPAAEASALVKQARERHAWGDKETAALRALLPKLSQQEAAAVLSELVPAINRQEIKPNVRGPLF